MLMLFLGVVNLGSDLRSSQSSAMVDLMILSLTYKKLLEMSFESFYFLRQYSKEELMSELILMNWRQLSLLASYCVLFG